MSVNGAPFDPVGGSWPEKWNGFEFRVGVVPVFEEGDSEDGKLAVISRWTRLVTGLALACCLLEEDEDSVLTGEKEGRAVKAVVKRYERSQINRQICIMKYGTCCRICGFDFEKAYGPLGKGFIHVHHIVPVSEIGPDYLIDPAKDLIPVCPNCHAMLHRASPTLKPDELKRLIGTCAQGGPPL